MAGHPDVRVISRDRSSALAAGAQQGAPTLSRSRTAFTWSRTPPWLPESDATVARYAQRLRQRQPEHLDPWLSRATASPLVPLQQFAKGLRDDYEAVNAGVTLPWSHVPVEGHINRLKTLKRQMFGRASLDLLQRRLMLAA